MEVAAGDHGVRNLCRSCGLSTGRYVGGTVSGYCCFGSYCLRELCCVRIVKCGCFLRFFFNILITLKIR